MFLGLDLAIQVRYCDIFEIPMQKLIESVWKALVVCDQIWGTTLSLTENVIFDVKLFFDSYFCFVFSSNKIDL